MHENVTSETWWRRSDESHFTITPEQIIRLPSTTPAQRARRYAAAVRCVAFMIERGRDLMSGRVGSSDLRVNMHTDQLRPLQAELDKLTQAGLLDRELVERMLAAPEAVTAELLKLDQSESAAA